MQYLNIDKTDEVIANFLDWKYFTYGKTKNTRLSEGWYDNYYKGKTTELKFHSDWNWLMSAVERIKFIKDNQEEFFGEEYYLIHFEIDLLNGVDLKIDKDRIFMQTAFGEGQLIEAVYNGVIEFIKWFNKNI